MSNEAKKTTKKAKSKHLYLIVTTALCAAIIAVMTSSVRFSTGINDGYLHFGDSMIYISACILPLPYAMIAAALGGAIADILAGAAVWAPFTAVIKALNAVPFALMYTLKVTKQPNKILNKATAGMPVLSGLITVFGYVLAEGILYSFPTAWASLPLNVVQAVGSAIIYYIVAVALDKMNFKSKVIK